MDPNYGIPPTGHGSIDGSWTTDVGPDILENMLWPPTGPPTNRVSDYGPSVAFVGSCTRSWKAAFLSYLLEFELAGFQALAQAMTAQDNLEVVARVNLNGNTSATSVWDFTRMNLLKSHGSKVDDDPQKFI
uniref:Uncharacterized protein n=1 Tax=Solanum tuberosum TaxID=4113 RepID=M1DRC2_SOLTU